MRENANTARQQLDRILKWDEAAFHTLYQDYYGALVNYALQLTGELSTAEDVVQDCFSNLVGRSMKFDSMAQLRSYLYNMVHHGAIDYLRHHQVTLAHQDNLRRYQVGTDGEEDFFSEEVFRQLFAEIDRLPSRQREVFLMLMDGHKNREIATMLDMSVETVKTYRKRSLATLKARLGNKSFFVCGLLLSV